MSSALGTSSVPADGPAVTAAKVAAANASRPAESQGTGPVPSAALPTSASSVALSTSSDALKPLPIDPTLTQAPILATPAPNEAVKITISDKPPLTDGPVVSHAPDAQTTSILITPGPTPAAPATIVPTTSTIAPQLPPTSIPIPPPEPSTLSAIKAPPTPDHITLPPKTLPVLANPGAPTTPAIEVPHPLGKTTASPALYGDAHKQPERMDTLVDLNSHVLPQSRRNSADGGKPKPSNLPLPARPGYSRAASSGDLRSGMASPNISAGAIESTLSAVPHGHAGQASSPLSQLTLFAGQGRKPFYVHRQVLITKVPYFSDLLANGASPDATALTFEDLDEYGFALLVRWLYGGALHGPRDFHGFTHYLALYCLAVRFGIEPLQNEAIDLCRAYYRQHSMTAPAYRLEYVYTFTSGPNHMRRFLVTTAAYRSLCDAPPTPGVYISDSMKALLAKGGDVATDFAEALVRLSKDGLVDVRKGDGSAYHVGADNNLAQGLEPWQDP